MKKKTPFSITYDSTDATNSTIIVAESTTNNEKIGKRATEVSRHQEESGPVAIQTEIYISGSTSVATVIRRVTQMINELAFPEFACEDSISTTNTAVGVSANETNLPKTSSRPPQQQPHLSIPKYISLRGLGQGIDRAAIVAVRLQQAGFLVSFHTGTVSIIEQPAPSTAVVTTVSCFEPQQEKDKKQTRKDSTKTPVVTVSKSGAPVTGTVRRIPSMEVRIYVAQYLSNPNRLGCRPH